MVCVKFNDSVIISTINGNDEWMCEWSVDGMRDRKREVTILSFLGSNSL